MPTEKVLFLGTRMRALQLSGGEPDKSPLRLRRICIFHVQGCRPVGYRSQKKFLRDRMGSLRLQVRLQSSNYKNQNFESLAFFVDNKLQIVPSRISDTVSKMLNLFLRCARVRCLRHAGVPTCLTAVVVLVHKHDEFIEHVLIMFVNGMICLN